eukprot:1161177-Pelagomonas_calceolata.AAC.6
MQLFIHQTSWSMPVRNPNLLPRSSAFTHLHALLQAQHGFLKKLHSGGLSNASGLRANQRAGRPSFDGASMV